MSFEVVHTLSRDGGCIDEPTLSYVGDKLVCVCRGDGNYNTASIFITNDLNGSSGWREIPFNIIIHSPCLLPYNKNYIFPMMGSYPVSANVRCPMFAYYDLEHETFLSLKVIDNSLTGYGGYPSMVRLGENDFRTMYYDDLQNTKTANYYKAINPYLECDIDYFI